MQWASVFCLTILAFGAFACGSENAVPHQQQPQPTAVRFAPDGIPVPTPTTMIVEAPERVPLAHVDAGAATASLEERMCFAEIEGEAPPVVSDTAPAVAAPATVAPEPPPAMPSPSPVGSGTPLSTVPQVPIGFTGPSSLEQRILASPLIARVRLNSATSTVESGPTYRGLKYLALLEFRLSVLEYLKGSGASDIVAVWNAGQIFNTRQDAEGALPAIAPARDARWDDREAIIFLLHSQTYLSSTQQTGRFYPSGEHYVGGILDDYYSIASRSNKLWLPAEAALGTSSQPIGDQQRFLLDVPSETGEGPTITLGELKGRIAEVTAKLAAGDGSEEYRKCVEDTYRYEGINRYRVEKGDEGYFYRIPDQELDSGLATLSLVYEQLALGGLLSRRDELWFDGGGGGDANLFSVEFGESIPHDSSGDGVTDSIQYSQRVLSTRPLPAGVYRLYFNQRNVHFVPCEGHTVDPSTTTGVLEPAEFSTAAATTTITGLNWQSGSVVLSLSPFASLGDHQLEFIALDGSTALALRAYDATADSAAGTLTWAVADKPWSADDMLMLRIGPAPDSAPSR